MVLKIGKFQPSVAYKSVAYRKSVYAEDCQKNDEIIAKVLELWDEISA